MTILLKNDQITIEIEPEHGCIVRFIHEPLAIDLVRETRLAENFRLLLPLPYYRAHYVLGKEQALTEYVLEDTTCRLVWRGLQTAQGHFDIDVVQTIRLDGDDAIFNIEVTNHSPYIVEEVFNIALGGLANFEEKRDWRIHWANWGGQGSEWTFYDTFPGTYLGPAHPVWTIMYHKEMSLPWVSLYNSKARKGVYIGNHDLEVRHSMVYAQLFPSTVYRNPTGGGVERNTAQGWPDPVVAGDTPVGLTLAWNNFPFIRQNSLWSGPPIVFHFHEGTWWAAADYFRAWYDTHTTFDKSDSWLSYEDAWQSTIISYPDDQIGFRFKDLPEIARQAKACGIHVIQIDGWDIGGLDRGYPQYQPDPRLGTWDELAAAIQTCMDMGVYVLIFSNLQWINIELDWYRDELERYAMRDPHGNPRGGMGWEYNTSLGLNKQPIYRMVPGNLMYPEFRQIILNQLQNIVRLGAPGTQIDKVGAMWEFDYSPDNPVSPDRATMQGVLETMEAYYHQSRAANPNFRLAGEIHWDRMIPFVDAAYARFFSLNHIPTFQHTFPEYRQTACITGDYDYGMVNNCLRFGHIINVEARCIHGTAADMPELGRYIAEALRVRRELRDVLWDSQLIEPLNFEIDAPPELFYALHRSRVSNRQALVLNHFESTEISAQINRVDGTGHATLYRPFKDSESLSLPGSLRIPPNEFAVLVFDH